MTTTDDMTTIQDLEQQLAEAKRLHSDAAISRDQLRLTISNLERQRDELAVVPLEDVRPLVEALINCEHHIECSWRTAINCPPGKCDCGRDDALATFTAKHPL